MNASPAFNSFNLHQSLQSMKGQSLAPKIRFSSSKGMAFRQITPHENLPSFLPQSAQNFSSIYHAPSQERSFPYPNIQASHQNQFCSVFPNTNPTGYRMQEQHTLAYKWRGGFQPLRRTEQTASELRLSVVDEPLILQDLVDFEGQFSQGMRCRQQVEYQIIEQGEQKNKGLCRKWC